MIPVPLTLVLNAEDLGSLMEKLAVLGVQLGGHPQRFLPFTYAVLIQQAPCFLDHAKSHLSETRGNKVTASKGRAKKTLDYGGKRQSVKTTLLFVVSV